MSDARLILDIPSDTRLNCDKHKKTKLGKVRAKAKSTSERELERLLHDQKLFIGSQSNVFHEVHQSILEGKKRAAEEQWQQALSRKRSSQQYHWATYTSHVQGGRLTKTFWAPAASVERYPPFPNNLFRSGSRALMKLNASANEWMNFEKCCTLPSKWKYEDLCMLFHAVNTLGPRWLVIADRYKLPQASERHSNALLSDPKHLALMYYAFAHFLAEKRASESAMIEQWRHHPLCLYHRKNEGPAEELQTDNCHRKELLRTVEVSNRNNSKHVRTKEEHIKEGSSLHATKYDIYLDKRSVHQHQLYSLHQAVLFLNSNTTADKVELLLEAHTAPEVYLASEKVHLKMDVLRRLLRVFIY